jgi:acyl-homoserine-lactone acylase
MRNLLRRLWIGLLAFAPILIVLNLALFALRSAAWQPDAAIAEAAQYDVEIIRDAYGAPHIYGKRDVDVAFGLSYAHAEDDFKTMQQMIPFYRGQLAREIGLDGAPIDFLVHWLGVRDHVRKNYETALTPQIRAHLKAYSDGLN